jgi:transcriptional regulator with XRE-family HTH domain
MSDRSPVASRRRLGQHLRDLRERLGLTGEEAAKAIERSTSWISRVEGGRIGIRSKELRELLDRYGVRDVNLRQELLELAEQGRQRAWWSEYRGSISETYYRYIGYEHEASRVDWAGHAVIPGLLQTEDYARAVNERFLPPLSDRAIRDGVAIRLKRQELLRSPRELQLSVLLDEAVLRRLVGTRAALCGQLDALLTAMAYPNVEVRLLPEGALAAAGMPLNLTIFTLGADEPRIVHREDALTADFQEGDQAAPHVAAVEHLRSTARSVAESRVIIRGIRHEIC